MVAAPSLRVLRPRDVVRRIGRRRTRLVGAVFIAYGASGIVLLAALALAVLPMMATIDTVARSSADVRATLATTRDAFDGFGTSLVDARHSAERASAAARSSATAAKQLADGMSISIFGAQPLISLSTGFQRQSADLQALGDELDRLAASLGRNEADVHAIREEVASLQVRAGAVGVDGAAWLLPGLFLFIAWLALPAAAALWAGIALLRYSSSRPRA